MFKNIFLKIGLTTTQAEIMNYLYEKKIDKASKIAKSLKKSRVIIYKDLEKLINPSIDGEALQIIGGKNKFQAGYRYASAFGSEQIYVLILI